MHPTLTYMWCVCVLKAAHVCPRRTCTWWEQASRITLSSKWDGDTWSAKGEELKRVGGNKLLSHERWRPGRVVWKTKVELRKEAAFIFPPSSYSCLQKQRVMCHWTLFMRLESHPNNESGNLCMRARENVAAVSSWTCAQSHSGAADVTGRPSQGTEWGLGEQTPLG